jgi:hypothetical protein
MTFFCFLLMAGDGVPVFILLAAMVCDTALLVTAMLTGIIHYGH